MSRLLCLILILGLSAALSVSAITAEEIVDNVERNEINDEERID